MDMDFGFRTVYLDEENVELCVLDQTKLPEREEYLHLSDAEQIRDAIKRLCVRGAPAIGVAAAIGLYVVAERLPEGEHYARQLWQAAERIESARPTAVNLRWAIERMRGKVVGEGFVKQEIVKVLREEAMAIYHEDIQVNRRIGEIGAQLLSDGDAILTHCNAGILATAGYGTALAPIYIAKEQGKNIRVYADETRPLLQGARLTAWELNRAGIDVTLICDNMAGTVLSKGDVKAVFVGCDRVAANGDTANKIGTMPLAIAAKYYGVPFYVLGPSSTIDMRCKGGKDIEIEQRDPPEVMELWYEKRMAPEGIRVFNPAFDVTPNELITGIITEKGMLKAPFVESIWAAMAGSNAQAAHFN